MLKLALALASFVAVTLTPALSQDYPSRPIRIIIPFAPGGGSDLTARPLADFMTKRLGQPVVAENKPGAGSALGIDYVAKSKPDGYTLLWQTSDGISVLPAVKASLPYRVPEDFAWVAGFVTYSHVIAVNPDRPYKTLQELIAWAKDNPGKVRFGSSGLGNGAHLVGELFAHTAGIKLVHVPFNGGGPAVTAAVGGHIDMVMLTPSSTKTHIDAGRLLAFATTQANRDPLLPNVPTLAEAGLPGLVMGGYYGMLAPAGTPEPILAKLRGEIQAMMKEPVIMDRIASFGLKAAYLSGEDYRAFMVRDLERWKGVAKAANVVLND
jgi:tripartite-type tricarboxylate transporter receptor subunit TctC